METDKSKRSLKMICVGDIVDKGYQFVIPSYQRGYRWGKREAEELLNDIYWGNNFFEKIKSGKSRKKRKKTSKKKPRSYYLQPIVVKKERDSDIYEVIDGQQRLTTIYILYKYINSQKQKSEPSQNPETHIYTPYEFEYKTREKSWEFLSRYPMSEKDKDDNIDFYHMSQVYDSIKEWFEKADRNQSELCDQMKDYFDHHVKVIWYQVGKSENSIQLFTRLNSRRIPLTEAELVKALLLQRDTNGQRNGETREVISMRWEEMEAELHKEPFWLFLTNQEDPRYSARKYRTRIELILELAAVELAEVELAAEIRNDRSDELAVFRFFEKKCQDVTGREMVWNKIRMAFLRVKGWYEDQDMYHKMGYLIALESLVPSKEQEEHYTILDIYQNFVSPKNPGKSQSKEDDAEEKTTFSWKDMREFENKWLNKKIEERVKSIFDEKSTIWEFSYKREQDKNKMKALLLLFNVETMRTLGKKDQRFPFYIFKMVDSRNPWGLEHIHAQRSKDSRPVTHNISNMALLRNKDNNALDNKPFNEKRDELRELEEKGSFIPICTRRVFSKYYTRTDGDGSVNFECWDDYDERCYVDAITEQLKQYRPEKVPEAEKNNGGE